MSRRSKYSPEFKREAVKLAQSSDKKLYIIAEELGVVGEILANLKIQCFTEYLHGLIF